MVRKQTWILLAVLAVLVGVTLYLQKNPLPDNASVTPSATSQPVLLRNVQPNDINLVELLNSGEQTPVQISLDDQGGWTYTGKEKSKADSGKMEQVRSEVTALRVIATLPVDYPADSIGLKTPAQTLTIGTKAGQKVSIRIGKETPTQDGYYVQIGLDAPAVVNKTALDGILNLIKEAVPVPTGQAPATTETPQQTPAP